MKSAALTVALLGTFGAACREELPPAETTPVAQTTATPSERETV